MDITFYEKPLPEGHVYPCSLDDLRARVAACPAGDIEGLKAMGLAPSTRKDGSADARYFARRAAIEVYSRPADLSFKMPQGVQMHDLERWAPDEIAFGMRTVRDGSRIVCRWDAADLRRCILFHVLPHELGHHVVRRDHIVGHMTSTVYREQLADAFAHRLQPVLEKALDRVAPLR